MRQRYGNPDYSGRLYLCPTGPNVSFETALTQFSGEWNVVPHTVRSMDSHKVATHRARRGALAALVGIATTVTALAASPVEAASPRLAPHVAGRVIVGYAPGTTTVQRVALRNATGARLQRSLATQGRGADLVSVPAGQSVASTIAALKKNPAVRYAEPDYIVTKQATSNDPYFTNGSLWGMQGDGSSPANQFGSGAAEAWAQGYTGSDNVYVGIIDEGVQVAHPDLAANMWVNPYEIASNGVDDDGNGYRDDVYGWDFANGDASVYDGSATNTGLDAHGTHVGGTIGGVGGNGVGVAGVNWNVTMISAKFLGANGGAISNAVSALNYLTDLKTRHGLNIVASSNSWGGGGFSQAMLDAINASGNAGMLFIAAAGNSGTNNDTTANYPSNYQCTNGGTRGWDCVVAVAATDSAGGIASFSQYGATTVDIGAPGVGVWSSVPQGSYSSYNGTSMATPHVSGAVALCASIDPTLTARQLRDILTQNAAPTTSLTGKTATGGRLDMGAMASACAPTPIPVSGSVSGLAATAASSTSVNLSWTDGASDESRMEIEKATSTNSVCGTWSSAGQAGANSTTFTVAGLTESTTYCFRVRAANGYNGGSFTSWSNEATATTLAPPPPFTCSSTTYSWVDATTGATSHVLGDDGAAAVTLPFSFSMYGTSSNTAQVGANGYLRIGSGAATAYANTNIPNAADPNNIIAAWWDDLDQSAGGTITTRTAGTAPNRQFVTSWNGVPHFGAATTNVTFQIVLDEASGDVYLNYQDTQTGAAASNSGASATAGIENAAGTVGAQISSNSASLANSTAYRCTTNVDPIAPPVVTTASLPAGTTTVAYLQTLAASGGEAPYTWSLASGTLPAGLTLGSDGVISGTPTTAGTSTFTVRATDSGSRAGTKSLSIVVATPVTVTTASLANGTVGTALSRTLAASGGTTPYTWSLASGALPAGLSLSSVGVISGTPTTAGTANFTVRVTDSLSRTATRDLSLTIAAAAAPGAFNKTAPSNNATGQSRSSLKLSWGASTGAVRYEYCYDTTNDNACSNWISTSTTRSVTLRNLGSLTAYYWQVRSVNAAGLMTYANASTYWKFTTRV